MSKASIAGLPANDFVLLIADPTTGDDVACPAGTRGLLIQTAGLLDITINGQDRDLVPLPAGITWGRFEEVRVDASNTAANIWAVL